MNFEYSASRWMEATHIYARIFTHTQTHTRTQTHTHTYTHTCTCVHTKKQSVTLHILVSSISSEGVVYHYSDVSTDGKTARFHVTLWTDCIAMSMMCCKREPFISFGNIKCLSTNFVGVTNWIFLKKILSLEIVIVKRPVRHAVVESLKIVIATVAESIKILMSI